MEAIRIQEAKRSEPEPSDPFMSLLLEMLCHQLLPGMAHHDYPVLSLSMIACHFKPVGVGASLPSISFEQEHAGNPFIHIRA